MADRHILLREMTPYKLDDYVRMSIGTDDEMEDCFSAFTALMDHQIVTMIYSKIAIIGIGLLVPRLQSLQNMKSLLAQSLALMPMMSAPSKRAWHWRCHI